MAAKDLPQLGIAAALKLRKRISSATGTGGGAKFKTEHATIALAPRLSESCRTRKLPADSVLASAVLEWRTRPFPRH